ncbi:MAG: hypothetical protein AAGI53_07185 [Planctomycetota bacterium]
MPMKTTVAAIAATTTLAAGGVSGSIFVPYDSDVSLVLLSRHAGFSGDLSLVSPLEDAGATLFLSDNEWSSLHRWVEVGTFAEGDELVFQYEITNGDHTVFRSDSVSGAIQFDHEFVRPDSAVLSIEDVEFESSDRDYNDAVFGLYFEPLTVPAPGAIVMGVAGLALVGLRARRV